MTLNMTGTKQPLIHNYYSPIILQDHSGPPIKSRDASGCLINQSWLGYNVEWKNDNVVAASVDFYLCSLAKPIGLG